MIWYAWITDFSSVAATDPDQITGTIGHELAEMFTDPIASAWWCAASAFEIGDAEFSQGNTRQTARVNGVRVDAYWSNQDAATVIPVDRDYRARLRARVSPTASVELDSGTLRPTDREKTFCQIEDKDDAWRITGWDETATISVETGRFAQPRAHWVVAGQPVSGSGRLSVSVGVEQFVFVGPDIHPGAIYAQTNEVLEFVATDTTLTLTTDNAYANFDVTVEARVEETDFTGNVRTRQLQRVRRPRVPGQQTLHRPGVRQGRRFLPTASEGSLRFGRRPSDPAPRRSGVRHPGICRSRARGAGAETAAVGRGRGANGLAGDGARGHRRPAGG